MDAEDRNQSQRKKSPWPIVAGFGMTAGAFALVFGSPPGELGRAADYFVVDILLTLIGVILAVIPVTRRFGLGMLLACGAVWLIVGAMCGGLLK